MQKTLIVGYGNADREDDGVAWHVLSKIAQRLGRAVPNVPEDGFFPEDEDIDLWYVLQLVPEMAEEFTHYQQVIFVDAHTGNIPQEIYLQPVDDSPASSSFTHHFTPAACMALTRSIYHASPKGVLLSLRGYSFGFSRSLSERTAALVDQAVEMIWVLLGTG
jgi:hydrogenase maturation protease